MKLYESKALMEMMIFALALKFIVLTSFLPYYMMILNNFK